MGDKKKIHWPAVAIVVLLVVATVATVLVVRATQNTPDQVSAIIGLWTVAISSSALITVYYQLKLHRQERATDWERQQQALKADHDRRKKQATIEIVERLTPRLRDLRVKIEQKLGSGHLKPLSDDQNARIRTDGESELRGWVSELLNMLELLATGVNTRVYDDKLLFRLSKSFLLGLSNQFEIYITETQRTQPTNYSEFVALMKRFQKWRIHPPDPDTVVISPGGAR